MKKHKTKKLTPERLQQLGFAYAPPLIISAAVNNKIFDSLQGGAKTVEQLKKETGADARGLRAIMDALVGLELLKKNRQSRYSLTPESEALFNVIRQCYGHRLSSDELEEVRKGVAGISQAAAALRAVRLNNSDEPFSVGIPYRQEG